MRGVAAAAGAVVLVWAWPAAADKLDATVDYSLRAGGGWFDGGEIPLHASPFSEPPEVLAALEPRLLGVGRAGWASYRGNFTLHGFRFGSEVGALGIDGLRLATVRLEGVELTTGPLWGMIFAVFAGYAFGDPREPRPYLDVRGAFTLLETLLEPSVRGSSLGSTAYEAYLPSFGIAGGVTVPLGELFFADVGAHLDILGPLRFSPYAAIGIPVPTANL
jgi:hypothetical protein